MRQNSGDNLADELLKSYFMYEELLDTGERNLDNRENSKHLYVSFSVLFWLTQITGLCMVILTIVWVFKYWGGVGWRDNPADEFNWHTLSMTVGFIYLFGTDLLIFRCLRSLPLWVLKVLHSAIGIIIAVCVTFGYLTILDSHNFENPPLPNWYSLHSWLGLFATALFVSQWVLGCLIYLCPGVTLSARATFSPLHVYLGLAAFVLASAVALLGFFEEFNWIHGYQQINMQTVLVNSLGIFLVLYTMLVVFLISHSGYKREPLPHDE